MSGYMRDKSYRPRGSGLRSGPASLARAREADDIDSAERRRLFQRDPGNPAFQRDPEFPPGPEAGDSGYLGSPGTTSLAPERMKKGGAVKKMANGGSVASKRADGCAARGKTKGKFV